MDMLSRYHPPFRNTRPDRPAKTLSPQKYTVSAQRHYNDKHTDKKERIHLWLMVFVRPLPRGIYSATGRPLPRLHSAQATNLKHGLIGEELSYLLQLVNPGQDLSCSITPNLDMTEVYFTRRRHGTTEITLTEQRRDTPTGSCPVAVVNYHTNLTWLCGFLENQRIVDFLALSSF